MQQYNDYARLEVNKTVVVDLLPTKFEDKTDTLGFISQDPDEHEFLVADAYYVTDSKVYRDRKQ